ncbi:cardiolipin synthase ClsB [Massilia sp. TS11]|uniref:cardiolipin synthase ClsB n=1 Tax=Massilia sp. TS11 TaxID=2908003 RepID=UPI001EDA88B0|nr:cardiolipin synthase ClsB [Massilia sp. TS11]MCG2584995.1 cardiolipin synthase ClsB [Massilia sp. TS11]
MRAVRYLGDNTVTLLHTGMALFPALLAAIDTAQQSVYFETYIFADDATGQAVCAALCRAARRGVQVYVITDWWGTGRVHSASLHAELSAAGAGHRSFNPWFRRGVSRTHRKLCVVDRREAFVGGINTNDDLLSDDGSAQPLPAPRWDFAVHVRGPLVAPIHEELQAQWARLGRLSLLRRIGLYRDLRRFQRSQPGQPTEAGFVVRDNLRNRAMIQRAYLQAIANARDSVLMANPYFAPGRKFRAALAHAARRGVRVRLLIGVGEHALQDAVAKAFYPRLLADGVEVIEYRKTQLHGKVAVVDGVWATVGSSNVDGLSLFVNQEANVVVRDARFAADLRHRIEAAMAEGVAVSPVDFANIPWQRRLGYSLAYWIYRALMRVFAIGYA